MSLEIVFSGGDVDRAAHRRGEAALRAREPSARWAVAWRGRPLFRETGGSLRLAWTGATELKALPDLSTLPSVYLGEAPDGPRFAADATAALPDLAAPAQSFVDATRTELTPGRVFADLRAVMAQVDPTDAGDAATAKGLLEWHRTHGHCARCGAPSEMEDGGWRRGCPACGAKHFPRTDPVVIMLVLHGDRALLGRQAIWPERMYSLLAGYMEPGETIEEAVRRETAEEAGVPVGRVGYVCSQPWPFPASLMIACVAEATDDAIHRADAELEDAIWAEKAEVAASLRGEPARFTAARKGAVARTVLEAWVAGRISL
jgi:NAD+ diphosphatase